MVLSLDRKAFIDTLSQGQGDIGGVLQPPPEGQWGMPPELLNQLPGYGPDVEKNRAQARQIMQKLGYLPDKSLPIKVSTRAAISVSIIVRAMGALGAFELCAMSNE